MVEGASWLLDILSSADSHGWILRQEIDTSALLILTDSTCMWWLRQRSRVGAVSAASSSDILILLKKGKLLLIHIIFKF